VRRQRRQIPSEVATLRGRVAALTRSRPPNDPELLAARAELKAASAREYIRRLVDEAPPLTDEHRRRLVAMLHAGPTAPDTGGR